MVNVELVSEYIQSISRDLSCNGIGVESISGCGLTIGEVYPGHFEDILNTLGCGGWDRCSTISAFGHTTVKLTKSAKRINVKGRVGIELLVSESSNGRVILTAIPFEF